MTITKRVMIAVTLAALVPAGLLALVVLTAAPETLGWVVGVLVIASVAAPMVGWFASRPIKKGVAAYESRFAALAGGNTGVRAKGTDPLGLAGEFNSMAQSLGRREESVRNWIDELQRRARQHSAELDSAQEQVLRSRRLTALGSLGAGFAHELGNPLTAVLGMAGLLRRRLGNNEDLSESLEILVDEAQRIKRVVDQFKAFADEERATGAERFAPIRPVKEALGLYAAAIREHRIRLDLMVGEDLPTVVGSQDQFQSAITQLLKNAVTAMPGGGCLAIDLHGLPDAIRLCIKDSGRGIPPRIRDRIFDPFFSTKENGTQLGMGLSVVHRIISDHHGQISVDSEEGEGSSFTVVLPAAPERAHLE